MYKYVQWLYLCFKLRKYLDDLCLNWGQTDVNQITVISWPRQEVTGNGRKTACHGITCIICRGSDNCSPQLRFNMGNPNTLYHIMYIYM